MNAAQSAAVTEFGSDSRFSRTLWRISMIRSMPVWAALRVLGAEVAITRSLKWSEDRLQQDDYVAANMTRPPPRRAPDAPGEAPWLYNPGNAVDGIRYIPFEDGMQQGALRH
jgi:hypothetical protein